MRIKFFLKEISDIYLRDNFKRLGDAISSEPVLVSGFQFLSVVVSTGVTKKSTPHHLNFMPKDVILLSVSGDENVTFHYDLFTRDNIVFTATGACTFRCFVGTYSGGAT